MNVIDRLQIERLRHILPEGFGRPFPKGAFVRQKFEGPEIPDVETVVRGQLKRPRLRIQPGMRIAVGVGSRGISSLAGIVKTALEELKARGAKPFIIPAMGSHGGATPEGQRQVLASYGITEESLGVPIEDSMEVVELGRTKGDVPVYFSKAALQADAVLPICRIKTHTAFHGSYESGTLKMLAIGYGKHKGAATLHLQGLHRFPELLPEMGKVIMEKASVLCALACVENAHEKPALVEVLLPEEIWDREPQLLKKSKKWMGRILFDQFDLLVVDEVGKNISGDGMDPNVTGRFGLPSVSGGPRIQKIVALDMTRESHGNACGLGMADITTQTLVEKLDFFATYTNSITSTVLVMSRLPVVMPTAEDAIALGLGTCNGVTPPQARVVRINNTLELDRIWISDSLLQEASKRSDFEILDPAPLMSDVNVGNSWKLRS
ncbi:MAG: DUF362 domain-containing protein [Acidobacteriota bacterium]